MTVACDGEKPTYQNCSESPLPPDAVGMKSGFAAQFAPQLKLIVVLGLQYAALAKKREGCERRDLRRTKSSNALSLGGLNEL